jgi:hypothetical protein
LDYRSAILSIFDIQYRGFEKYPTKTAETRSPNYQKFGYFSNPLYCMSNILKIADR